MPWSGMGKALNKRFLNGCPGERNSGKPAAGHCESRLPSGSRGKAQEDTMCALPAGTAGPREDSGGGGGRGKLQGWLSPQPTAHPPPACRSRKGLSCQQSHCGPTATQPQELRLDAGHGAGLLRSLRLPLHTRAPSPDHRTGHGHLPSAERGPRLYPPRHCSWLVEETDREKPG